MERLLSQTPETEERLTLLIGLIVRRWADLEQLIWSEINTFQTFIQVRHMRARPPEEWSEEDFRPAAGQFTKNRLRHLRRLAVVLMPNSAQAEAVERLYDEAVRIYEIRNDIAHASSQSCHDGVILTSKELAKRFENEMQKRRPSLNEKMKDEDIKKLYRRHHSWIAKNLDAAAGRKFYDWQSLESAADRLRCIVIELSELSNYVNANGPLVPPVKTPS